MVIAWSKAVAARVQKSGGIPEMFRGWNEQVLMRLRGRGGGVKDSEQEPGTGNRMDSDAIYMQEMRELDGRRENEVLSSA